LTRGPVVFVADTVLWDGAAPPPRSAASDLAVVLDEARCCEPARLPEGSLGPGLRIPVELADGSRVQARAWPFANVGAWFWPGAPRPDRDRAAFSYAVWLRGRGDANRSIPAGANSASPEPNDVFRLLFDTRTSLERPATGDPP
jgi:hypothetical protein